jgi:hypothetical protein
VGPEVDPERYEDCWKKMAVIRLSRKYGMLPFLKKKKKNIIRERLNKPSDRSGRPRLSSKHRFWKAM